MSRRPLAREWSVLRTESWSRGLLFAVHDLAAALRRLATDDEFRSRVQTDPGNALAAYDLSGDDLAALALWLVERPQQPGVHSLFESEPCERSTGPDVA